MHCYINSEIIRFKKKKIVNLKKTGYDMRVLLKQLHVQALEKVITLRLLLLHFTNHLQNDEYNWK